MKIAVIFLRLILNFIYFFLKLFPTDNSKVLFLSRQSDTPSEDFLCLEARLRELKPGTKTVMITRRADNNFSSLLGFAGATLRSMYHLATARVCILDAYWPAVSVLKHKKQLTVIQLWHAMGKIKKSGYQSVGKKLGRSEMIAKQLRMHRNYDVIIAGGKAFNPFYCASFGVDESILYNVGLPRMDSLRENREKCRELFDSTYPWLRGKKIILYAPTFRKGHILDASAMRDAFDFERDDRILVVRRHPNQQLRLQSIRPALTCSKLPTSVLLSVCDCVITDYSAITIEAAILGKPVYFYPFDYEDYIAHNGLNVVLSDEFPNSVYRDPGELFAAIDRGDYDWESYRRFCDKYLPDLSGRATDKIAGLIIKCMEKDKKDAISECFAGQN
ncbi:MAG: CDP-glycerol glycerophosphotransferase family protein [Oscillospiraceae bacterium]|nr:CDP-glycerol glycerophosphotransferase family protein [Oscillospiraceae bacterium]